MITVNTNVNNLKLQRNLGAVNFNVQTAMERMSTGYRINSASDDAAGLVISKALQTQTNGLNIANQNATTALLAQSQNMGGSLALQLLSWIRN